MEKLIEYLLESFPSLPQRDINWIKDQKIASLKEFWDKSPEGLMLLLLAFRQGKTVGFRKIIGVQVRFAKLFPDLIAKSNSAAELAVGESFAVGSTSLTEFNKSRFNHAIGSTLTDVFNLKNRREIQLKFADICREELTSVMNFEI